MNLDDLKPEHLAEEAAYLDAECRRLRVALACLFNAAAIAVLTLEDPDATDEERAAALADLRAAVEGQ